ncbi:MAG: hypothetical protein JF616_18910 [Fibrobacteres bacterium]|nr:hypothetical protein [Fibrobacterota bacterium]
MERNGSNLYSSDPSFGIGYRSDGTNPSRVWMGAGNGFPLDFRVTNATQAMTISGTGNVGINNPNPQGTLDVRGGQSSATDGLPIVLSAQGGASTKNGGNIILNSGPNGAGGSNGAIIFATGGVLNSAGTGMAVGERMRIDAAGRLALGNSSPVCAFHLRNDDGVASGEHSWVNYERNGIGNGTDPVIGFGYRGDGSTNPTRVWMGAGNGFPLDFRVSGAQQAMSISGSGNVGINNPNPGERLDIDGNIKATGSITVASVVTKSWSVTPDYVFEKDYRLASLDDVEKFVDVHKHLPEVPSAKDLAKTGMNLAEMNVVLLKKVEELTLYSIEERKRNQALERRLDRLEQVAAHSDR